MIVAGFGFRAGATEASIRDAFVLASAGRAVGLLASVADKAEAPCLRAFARALGVPLRAVPADQLYGIATMTASGMVRAARGTGSVAEAAALVAAGPGAALLGARVVSGDRMATCALAKGAGS